jgi:hypothetical protein
MNSTGFSAKYPTSIGGNIETYAFMHVPVNTYSIINPYSAGPECLDQNPGRGEVLFTTALTLVVRLTPILVK